MPPYYPDIPEVLQKIVHHDGTLLNTDEHVGEVIAALKRDGLCDNTIIFLFSDHSIKLHRHNQFLYEGGIQMPLIVSGPGIEVGRLRDGLISGIDAPSQMEGRDFLTAD